MLPAGFSRLAWGLEPSSRLSIIHIGALEAGQEILAISAVAELARVQGRGDGLNSAARVSATHYRAHFRVSARTSSHRKIWRPFASGDSS
jgi:hypothetical protein